MRHDGACARQVSRNFAMRRTLCRCESTPSDARGSRCKLECYTTLYQHERAQRDILVRSPAILSPTQCAGSQRAHSYVTQDARSQARVPFALLHMRYTLVPVHKEVHRTQYSDLGCSHRLIC